MHFDQYLFIFIYEKGIAHIWSNRIFLLVITVQNNSNFSGKILKKIKSRPIYDQNQNEAPKIVYTSYVNEHLRIGDLAPLPLTNQLIAFEGVSGEIGIYIYIWHNLMKAFLWNHTQLCHCSQRSHVFSTLYCVWWNERQLR